MNHTKIGWLAIITVVACVTVGVYLKWTELFTIPKAREVFVSQVRDPSSAQFRNEKLTSRGWLCGEVNIKNGYGGYEGFKRYISGPVRGTQHLEDVGMLGERSTNEFIKILDKEIAILRDHNAIAERVPGIGRLSSDRTREKAVKAVFEDHWTEICSAKL